MGSAFTPDKSLKAEEFGWGADLFFASCVTTYDVCSTKK